jgi:hypothetical protein
MSIIIPDTKYLITNSQGEKVDISTIFNPGTYPSDTNFKFYNTINTSYDDLRTVINQIQPGNTPVANTGYKVIISGVPTDLSQIFQPKITASTYYTITPSYYPTQEFQTGGYYYIAFKYYTTSAIATITFNQNINNISVIVVGGGGCGREWSFFSGVIRSGGGGAGGGVARATFNAVINDSYDISVGQGGQVLGGGVVTSGLQTTFTSVSTPVNNIICTGGEAGKNDGSATAIGGVGTVSPGVFFTSITAGSGGNGGESKTSSTPPTSINNGGNSAILPPVSIPAGTFPYGLGGGGGAGNYGSTTNGGTAGNGNGGICGAAPTGKGTTPEGFGCGGGGSASQASDNGNTIGNNGLVLVYFTP